MVDVRVGMTLGDDDNVGEILGIDDGISEGLEDGDRLGTSLRAERSNLE